MRCAGPRAQICYVTTSIRSKIERDARRAVVVRLAAGTRSGCKLTAETARAVLPELVVVGRPGLAALIGKYRGYPGALTKTLRHLATCGVHAGDTTAQSRVIETIFSAAAHERTVTFAAAVGESRARARELLALYLVEMARGLLGTLEEEGAARVRSILDGFRTPSGSPSAPDWPVAYAGHRWMSLRLAPLLAVLRISAASGNGPAGLIGEFSAANRRVIDMALAYDTGSFIGALFHGGLCQRKLREFADQRLSAGQLIASLQRAVAAFDSVSLRERQAYRDVIAAATKAAADAARERVIFSRRGQLEDEDWALDDIQRLIVWPAAVKPAAISSPSA